MPVNDALMNIGANAMAAAATHASIHTAVPDAAGSNQSAAARRPISWAAAANGDVATNAALNFTGGAASGAAQYVGLWSAVSAGTFYGYFPLTGDQTFNAAGEYTVNSITLTGSQS